MVLNHLWHPGMSQREYVDACYEWYDYEGITPGDERAGVWNDAHYPLPKRHGDGWVQLLIQHHAVQGVIQSEEMGECCVSSWEKKYLEGELLERWTYWMRVKAEKGWEAARKSSVETNRRNKTGFFDPEVQRAGGRKTNGRLPSRLAGLEKARNTPGHQSKAGKRGGKVGKPILVTRLSDGHVFYFDTHADAILKLNLPKSGIGAKKDTGKPFAGHIIQSFN